VTTNAGKKTILETKVINDLLVYTWI